MKRRGFLGALAAIPAALKAIALGSEKPEANANGDVFNLSAKDKADLRFDGQIRSINGIAPDKHGDVNFAGDYFNEPRDAVSHSELGRVSTPHWQEPVQSIHDMFDLNPEDGWAVLVLEKETAWIFNGDTRHWVCITAPLPSPFVLESAG